MGKPTNVWNLELEDIDDGRRGARLLERPPGTHLVGAVWELDPGASSGPYHVHHATEEFVLVLDGQATLRSPDGERELPRGEVVHFPTGSPGAHQILNRSEEAATFLAVSSSGRPDIVVYPDSDKIGVGERLPRGGGLRGFFRRSDSVDYFVWVICAYVS